tara:strand:- start:855 stop:1799 length:945 start_codon:yes stop_codon:yes gene_type:complete
MGKQKIIVTGGFGFIGSAFVNLLKDNTNYHVVIVDKMTYAANLKNVKSGVSLIKKDICDITSHDLGEYDYLVHFAAESHVDNSIKDGNPFIHSNIQGTFNLIEVARQNKNLKKFIHISTDEVYGDMDDIIGEHEAKEDMPLKGSSYYSASKAASDLLVEAAGRTFNFPYIITRTCNNFGIDQYEEKFLPTIQKSVKEDKEIPVYGDGKQQREWIHVEDNAKAILLLMESIHSGVWNIGSGDRWTNINIVKAIGKILDKEIKFKYVNDRLGHDRAYAINSSKFRKAFPQWKPNLKLGEYLREKEHGFNWFNEHAI